MKPLRQDIITLQDPSHLEKFNIADFYHVKHDQKIEDEGKLFFMRYLAINFLTITV